MRRRKRAGQAIVEVALFITLLYMLLSATIDFGLAFFVAQGLAGSAQEGANFGSLKPMNGTAPNDGEIRQRARFEGGLTGSNQGFVDLLDLDNDGNADTSATLDTHILISVVKNNDAENTGIPVQCDADTRVVGYCDIVVQVRYKFKPQFPLARTFGANEIYLSASRRAPITR